MTNDRTREVATEILTRTRGVADVSYAASEAEAVILAYRDEVREQALNDAFDKLADASGDIAAKRDEPGHGIRFSMEMIHRLIMDARGTTPFETKIVGIPAPPPSRDADLDTVLRTLAQAYVGNDYTIEGRKFQAAVERLWPR